VLPFLLGLNGHAQHQCGKLAPFFVGGASVHFQLQRALPIFDAAWQQMPELCREERHSQHGVRNAPVHDGSTTNQATSTAAAQTLRGPSKHCRAHNHWDKQQRLNHPAQTQAYTLALQSRTVLAQAVTCVLYEFLTDVSTRTPGLSSSRSAKHRHASGNTEQRV
jgi:hypothetical protein